MALISYTPLQDGVTGVNAAATNTPLSTIYNDYNGNITDANVAASAAIAFSKISGGTSTALTAWQSFTSTPTNFTLGNGTMAGKYNQIGKTVFFDLYIKLGSSSSMSTAPTFTLPVTANSRYDFATFPNQITIGQFANYDVSATSTYTGPIIIASTTTFAPAPQRADFTWLNNPANVVTAGQPAAAYATGDLLWFTGTYEAA